MMLQAGLVTLQVADTCPDYPITHYNIILSNSSGEVVTSLELLPLKNETEIGFDGLRENAIYHVYVGAKNSIGSNVSNFSLCEHIYIMQLA